jgi:hypothetical protein
VPDHQVEQVVQHGRVEDGVELESIL